jgi:apolipoprotein N-acyltransferase
MLRVVQPNIRQQDKWARARQVPNFMLHLRLTAAPGPEAISHTIWPETATPFFLAERGDARRLMARAVARGGAVIAGAPRRSSPGRPFRLWNSLFAIDDTGAVTASYDKAHLVPFGEYVPLRRYLPLVKLVQGQVDYAPGPGRRTLRVPGLPPFSPLICYEAIFPGAVLDRSDRPAWLLNITNDAWFGTSAGPYQHLAIARTRAVEEGMALVRAANSGISAVIDPYGRVMARLGIGERGVIDSALPAPLEGATLFGRFGDWLTAFMISAALVVALLLGRRVGR